MSIGIAAFLSPAGFASGVENEPNSTFTVANVERALLHVTATASNRATAAETGISVLTVDGDSALVNASMIREDRPSALSAATADWVDLAWDEVSGATSYQVSRDNELIAVVSDTEFRDDAIRAGSTNSYRVDPVVPNPSGDVPIWGMYVVVPNSSAEDRAGLEAEASGVAAAAAAKWDNGTIMWRTFIPMDKVDAPPIELAGAGCEYKSGYQFGGDNRGFGDTWGAGTRNRTQLTSGFFFQNANAPIQGTIYSIYPTKVYEKASGDLVAERTLSVADAYHEVKALGRTATTIDIRVAQQAGNPFCTGNSIEGAFTIAVTNTGNYTILSGSHRQMPNHEIYLHGAGGTGGYGPFVSIYQRAYLDPTCLIALACGTAHMGGAGQF